MRVNFDQNWYDVMRQIIDNTVDGKYECYTSVNKNEQQYGLRVAVTIEKLHFEGESLFVPMRGDTDANNN